MSNESGGHHCPDHKDYHDTLIRVATNTEWIISALKTGSSILGAVLVVIVIPASIWLINLDKRVSNIEMQMSHQAKR